MTRTRPLGGVDVCLLAMDGVMGRDGLGSNRVAFVVECDGALDAGRLRAAAGRFLKRCPWWGSTPRRPLPWGPPRWSVSSSGPRDVGFAARDVAPDALQAALTETVERRLSSRVDPRHDPLVDLDVLAATDGGSSALVLTWFHPLMDPRGAENGVRWLAALDADPSLAEGGAGPTPLVADESPTPWRERMDKAKAGREVMDSYADTPPRSLGGRADVRAGARARCMRRRFDATEASSTRARRDMTYRLAVVGQALAPLFERAGVDVSRPMFLPVSVDRRKRGDPGPVVGNHLHLHHVAFTPGDPSRTSTALKLAFADVLRHDQLNAKTALLDLVGYAPLRWVSHKMAAGGDGETASFHFADTGAALDGLASLCGATPVDAWHAPALPRRPGLGVFLNQHGGHHDVVVSWVDGVVTEADVASVFASVRDGMGWVDAGSVASTAAGGGASSEREASHPGADDGPGGTAGAAGAGTGAA